MSESAEKRVTSASRGARWAAVIAWMIVIFALSSVRDPAVPSGLTTPGHAALYFALGVLLLEAIRVDAAPTRALALAVILASLYGASDEVHQFFVPTRTPDVLDWAWDTIGAAAGALAWGYMRSLLVRRHR